MNDYEKHRKYLKLSLIFAIVAIVALLFSLFVFVGSALSEEDDCGFVYSWPEHQYCDGGTRTLYMCTDENGGYFKTTCLGVPVAETWPYPAPATPEPYPAPVYLPLIANAFEAKYYPLPTPAPTMQPLCDTMLCGWCEEYPELCTLYP